MDEFLNQRDKIVQVRVGTLIPKGTIAGIQTDERAIEYLRRRTYLLSQRRHNTVRLHRVANFPFIRKEHHRIASEVGPDLLVSDIRALTPAHRVEETPEFSVYAARAANVPNVLQEIGRLREITFREAGEGCGRGRDLDQFDDYYLHVFLWDKRKQRVAGAYRMGICPEIIASKGPVGLYTSTLFHYQPEFFERLGPALELGRSFVVGEYQRKFSSLMLLWKGIASYIARHPQTPDVFGAVSISSRYTSASRELIFRYFESRRCEEISGFVRPRRPFRPHPFQPWDCAGTSRVLQDVEDLGASVFRIWRSTRRGFQFWSGITSSWVETSWPSTWTAISRTCWMGWLWWTCDEQDSATLERYMGAKGLKRFHQYHNSNPVSRTAEATPKNVCHPALN